MKDTIIKMFNLEPSELKDVEVVTTDFTVYALITLNVRHQKCPNCGCSTKRIHDYRRRTLTHAVLNDVYTTIVFNQRRYRCTCCNKSFPEANPFAKPNRHTSSYVVLRIMKLLRNPRMTFSQVADEVGLSVSSVIRIFDRYAGVAPVSMPTCLCIDEIYAIKYKQKIYACVLVDMQTSQVYDLLPSRKKSDLSGYFSRISSEERGKVRYICMDMFHLYKDVVSIYFPEAIICVDSFHVIKLINQAFTSVRVRVMKIWTLLNRYNISTKKGRKELEALVNYDNTIVIFDDLERCNCDVNQILGFINNFVEHSSTGFLFMFFKMLYQFLFNKISFSTAPLTIDHQCIIILSGLIKFFNFFQ